MLRSIFCIIDMDTKRSTLIQVKFSHTFGITDLIQLNASTNTKHIGRNHCNRNNPQREIFLQLIHLIDIKTATKNLPLKSLRYSSV